VAEGRRRLRSEHGVGVREWLAGRGLGWPTVKAAGLGVDGAGELLIPWRRRRRGAVDGGPAAAAVVYAVNVRHMAPGADPRYTMLKDSRRRGNLYPGPVDPRRPVLLCEGELDALLAAQVTGDLVQVATLGGAPQRPNPAVAAALAGCPRLCLALDADDAGEAACKRLLCLWPAATRLRPPAGMDLTEVHSKIGLRTWFEEAIR
jgi:hypothetical protein